MIHRAEVSPLVIVVAVRPFLIIGLILRLPLAHSFLRRILPHRSLVGLILRLPLALSFLRLLLSLRSRSLLVVRLFLRLPFPLGPLLLFLLLPPSLLHLRLLKFLPAGLGQLHFGVFRHQRPETLTARLGMRLPPQAPEPATASCAASGIAVLFCVRLADVEVARRFVAGVYEYYSPPWPHLWGHLLSHLLW